MANKQIKEWDNIFGNKIKIKEKRKIIFQGDILEFGVAFNTESTILKLKGTEKFQDENLIMILPKNRKIHKDTKGYIVLEI